MADISKITLPNGITYNIKDENALTTEEYNAGKRNSQWGEYFNSYDGLLQNIASGHYSHAEGLKTTASGSDSHSEGLNTTASGDYSHAEGSGSISSGEMSHAEGAGTKATGDRSHAEGFDTRASGFESHAEGDGTVASGIRSHAEGFGTISASSAQHTQGKFNIQDSNNKYAYIIGNGSNDSNRSNAFAIDWHGKIYVSNSQTGVDVSVLHHDVETLKTVNGVMFGYKINKNDTNPNTRVEYLYDAVGMTPAHMDFTNDVFDYGSWGSAWFVRNNRPVALNFDGTVDYELNHNDFTKKFDGTASDIFDTSYNGNFMSEIPLVYVKRWEDSNYNYVVFSDKKIDESYKAYAHTNADGVVQPYIYLPMFKGSVVSNKLRSIARQFPTGSTSGQEEIDYVEACGSGWQTWDWAKHELIADLLTLISKSTDSKGKFGNGAVRTYVSDSTKYNGKLPTGGYNSTVGDISTYSESSNGQFYGKNDNVSHVTAFYIEDFWGNRYDRCSGFHLVNNIYKVKMTLPYNLDATNYTSLSVSPPASTEGWLKNTSTSEYGSFPTEINATETTGYCAYFSKNASGNRLALIGGNCNNSNGRCGSRCIFINNESSNKVWSISSSPCYCAP